MIIKFKHTYITKTLHSSYYTSSYFITTPIFYVNAAPHLGHLYSAVIADAAHRFYKLLHPNKSTIFSTGTDEHGLKVQHAACSSNPEEVKHYCDTVATKYEQLFILCGISYTHFIRTTNEEHKVSVQNFWNLLKSKDCIYEGKYSGWYCVPDETFVTEKELQRKHDHNGNEILFSEVSGHPVEWSEENNFMFRLSSFRSDLLYWLKKEDRVVPSKFHKILLSWVSNDEDLLDISVSRPSSRIRWGIPVPMFPDQTIYVWLDALVNYLTVAGYPSLVTWPPTVHVVGKDILKFHGMYWPAFLMAAGLEPPEKLFVHSHWTVNDEKMSKSKNNVVDPFDTMKEYTVSGLRYFLLKEGVPHSDGNYREMEVVNMLNADLANTYGNLLNRCVSKTVNSNQIYPMLNKAEFHKLHAENENLKHLSEILSTLQDVVSQHYHSFNFYKGITIVLKTLYLCNKFFEEMKPWELRKDEANLVKLMCILHITLETLRICSIALQPIIPDISEKIFRKLNIPIHKRMWADMIPSWDNDNNQSENSQLSSENIVLYNKMLKK